MHLLVSVQYVRQTRQSVTPLPFSSAPKFWISLVRHFFAWFILLENILVFNPPRLILP